MVLTTKGKQMTPLYANIIELFTIRRQENGLFQVLFDGEPTFEMGADNVFHVDRKTYDLSFAEAKDYIFSEVLEIEAQEGQAAQERFISQNFDEANQLIR